MVFYNLDYVTIGILALILGGQVLVRRKLWFFKGTEGLALSRRFSKMLKWFWMISGVIVLGNQTILSFKQYEVWQSDSFSKFFLPPYQDISYFISYVGVRFFAPWVLSLVASLIFSWAAGYFNKKFDERFFEKEEIQLIALGVFLTGYPGFLFYLAVILVFGTLTSIFYQIFAKGRLSLYYLWMSFAIFAIIIKIKFLYIFGIADFWGQFSLGDFYHLLITD